MTTDKADKVHPIIEAMARAISRAMNQHQIDIGFAWEIDFKNLPDGSLDLERDWLECVPEAKAAAKVLLSAPANGHMIQAAVQTLHDDLEPTDQELAEIYTAMTAAARSEMGLEG